MGYERLDHVGFGKILRHVRPPVFEDSPQLDPARIVFGEKSFAMEKRDLVPVQIIGQIGGAFRIGAQIGQLVQAVVKLIEDEIDAPIADVAAIGDHRRVAGGFELLLNLDELSPVFGLMQIEFVENVLVVKNRRLDHVIADAIHQSVGRRLAA